MGAILLFGHPAGARFADAGRDIAAFNDASHRAVGALGVVDAAAPAAAALLLACALVIGALGSALLAGPAKAAEGTPSGRIPSAALLGHAGGCLAVALGGTGLDFYGVAGIVAAAVLLRPGPPPPAPGARPWRSLLLILLGALLFVAAGGLDGLLQAALRPRPIPEAWFVLAAESGGGIRPTAVLAFAAIAAAAAGMERSAGSAGLAVRAAAWALLLGPSHPCRALALAWSLRCMERAGLPPAARAAFAAALVAGMAALVFV